MAAEFLISVRQQLDTTGLREYAAEFRRVIASINQAFQAGQLTAGQAGQLLHQNQLRNALTLGAVAPSAIPERPIVRGQTQEALRETARATGTTLWTPLQIEDAKAQLNRGLQAMRDADRAREREFEREEARARSAAGGAGGREPPRRGRAAAAGDDEERENRYLRDRVRRAEERLAAVGEPGIQEGEDLYAAEARATAQDRLKKMQASTAEWERIRRNENDELRVMEESVNANVDRTETKRRMERAARQRIRAEEEAAERAEALANLGPVSRTQRFQQRLRQRGGGELDLLEASTRPTAGQLVGGALLTTARFAASGALLYGTMQTVRELVREAADLEKIFNQIERQLEATNQAGQMPEFRESILSIARETGQAADEVAFIAFQMQGAFNQVPEAVRRTREAIIVARVTGLDTAEVVDSLTAAAKSFGVSIEELGDEAIDLEERFGVLGRESLKVFGDVGTVAAEAGFELEEFAAIVGVAQQRSGRSGAAIAEALGRIIPGLSGVSSEIVRIYNTVPALQDNLTGLLEAIGRGDMGDVFLRLIRDYKDLDAATQAYVVDLVGQRRESQTLLAILPGYQQIIDKIDDGVSTAGKTQQYFSDLQETLRQRVDRLRQAMVIFGEALFRMGIGDLLKDAASAAAFFADSAASVVRFFSRINEASGGLIGNVIKLVVEFRALVFVLNQLTRIKVTETLLSLIHLIAARGVVPQVPYAGAAAARAAPTPPPPPRGFGQRAGDAAAGIFGFELVRRATAGGAGAAGAAGAASTAAGAAAATAVTQGVRRGLLARLLGAAGGPIGFGVVTVGSILQLIRGAAQERGEKLQETFDKMDNDSIEEYIREQSRGFQSSFLARTLPRFHGGEGPYISAKNELIRRRVRKEAEELRDPFRAADVANLLEEPGIFAVEGDTLADRMAAREEIFTKATEGEAAALTRVRTAIERIRARPDLNPKLEDALRRVKGLLDQRVDETGMSPAMRQVETAQRQYAAGEIGFGEYLETLRANIESFRQMMRFTALSEEDAEKYAQGLQEYRQALDAGIQQQIQSAGLLAELQGQEPEQAIIDVGVRALRNPDLSPEGRIQLTRTIIDAHRRLFETRQKLAASAEEQTRIVNEGLRLPTEVRIASIVSQFQTMEQNVTSFVSQIDGPENQTKFLMEIARNIVETGVDPAEAMRQAIVNRIETLQMFNALMGGQNPKIRQEIARLRGLLVNLPKGVEVTDQERQAASDAEKEAARQREIAEQQARGELAAARTGDPLEQARIRRDTAKALHERAQREGKSEQEKMEAEREYLNAERAYTEAQRDARSSVREINRGYAEIRGDVLGVARENLANARERLEAAKQLGNPQEIERAQLEVDRAIAEERKAELTNSDNILNLEQARAAARGDQLAVVNIQIRRAQDRLAEARARGDVNAENDALAELAGLERQRADAELTNVDSALNLEQALADARGDQVGALRIQIQRAQNRLTAALNRGDVNAENDARAELAGLERQIAEAELARADLREEADLAIAETQGDSVRVAQIQLDRARRRVEAARQRNDEDARMAAEADVIRREADVSRARVSEGAEDIDFALALEQITIQQAIRRFEELLKVAGDPDTIRDLQRRIFNLRRELGRDLQWNIPEQIRLPTLYEARRVVQAGGSQNYQDNRKIDISMQVDSNVDFEDAFSRIEQLVTSTPQPRFGIHGSLYRG